jgi:hypothetical protein
LAELVDFFQRLLVVLGAIVVFLFRGVLGVVDFLLLVLGFIELLEGAVHIDRADFKSALSIGCGRESQGQNHREKKKFFHNEALQVAGKGLDRNPLSSFKIDSRR